MIEAESIEAIREKADIFSVVSGYVQLKKAGKNYVGLCPFHSEKTPSFTVSPDRQMFYCFGCHEGGNAFSFIMKIENINFQEAVEFLGDKLGLEVKKTFGSAPAPQAQEVFYHATQLALQYFEACLADQKSGYRTRAYLEHRHISEAMAKHFALGYAPGGWEGLHKYLAGLGVDPKVMLHLGMVIPRQNEQGFYDRFRERLMFPIFDLRGRAIGFSGRSLDNTDPKYMNSPDSGIFIKGANLFGLNFSKDEIKKQRTAVIVEGNVDLISVFAAGFKNVVAPLGTAFTEAQAKLLARYCSTAVIAFDADKSGKDSSERTVEILRQFNFTVRVLDLPQGYDPDEFIHKNSAAAFGQLVTAAKPWLEFKIGRVLENANLREVESRARVISEIARLINIEKDPLTREEYAREVSKKTGIDWQVILAEIQRVGYRRNSPTARKAEFKIARPPEKIAWAEECVLRLALENNVYFDQAQQNLNFSDFTDPAHQRIAQVLFARPWGEPHTLLDALPDEASKKEFSKISVSGDAILDADRTLHDCINVIKAHHLKLKLKTIQEAIRLNEKDRTGDKLKDLHYEFDEISKQLRRLEGKVLQQV